MNYLKQEIIDKIKASIKENQGIQKIYQERFVNYRGKTTDTKEYYTEVVAEELLRNNILGSMGSINEIVRKSGYKVDSHDGVSHTVGSNRKEEIFCKDIFSLSKNGQKHFNEVGLIIDYQVPLKNRSSDTGVGKIDLISKTKDELWLLELKVEDNKETVLRCVLEIATYYQLLSKTKFLESYPEAATSSISDIRKGILVVKGSSQEAELDEMKCGQNKRDNLKIIMESLKVEAFTIDINHDVVKK
ncbi:MAG TPA: hypothetical protein VFC84_19530 [Desulfosporosinus sp.]|nr:hypothetical protein [Desulfosporosinus sp.]